jgi:hypothetical protein
LRVDWREVEEWEDVEKDLLEMKVERLGQKAFKREESASVINPLNTKCRLLYLKTQFHTAQ